jgi:hypothetical protein
MANIFQSTSDLNLVSVALHYLSGVNARVQKPTIS